MLVRRVMELRRMMSKDHETLVMAQNMIIFYNDIQNQHRFDSIDEQENDTVLINCKYYDLSDFKFQKDQNKLSLFHTNIGSLEKHKEELETTLNMLDYKFDIIALTETKIIKNFKNHDDEIVKIGLSNGLFGIQLDERRIASKLVLREARGNIKRLKNM